MLNFTLNSKFTEFERFSPFFLFRIKREAPVKHTAKHPFWFAIRTARPWFTPERTALLLPDSLFTPFTPKFATVKTTLTPKWLETETHQCDSNVHTGSQLLRHFPVWTVHISERICNFIKQVAKYKTQEALRFTPTVFTGVNWCNEQPITEQLIPAELYDWPVLHIHSAWQRPLKK